MRLREVVSSLLITLAAGCVEVEGDAPLATTEQELHGPVVVAGGPKSTGMVRFHGCPTCRGSSTLIRRDLVLTNKHVVNWTGASSVFLNFTNTPLTGGRDFQALAMWHAPTVDLSIVQLTCAIHATEVPVVPLATTEADLTTASKVTLAGYGPTSWTGTDFGVKRSGGIALPTPPAVFAWNSTTWWTNGLVGSAPGDSGGSLYADVGLVKKLAGVITWGSTTDASHYAAGIRVSANLAWINSVMAAAPLQADCPLAPPDDPPPPS